MIETIIIAGCAVVAVGAGIWAFWIENRPDSEDNTDVKTADKE